jgi:hypothetical protein
MLPTAHLTNEGHPDQWPDTQYVNTLLACQSAVDLGARLVMTTYIFHLQLLSL